ncbi:helix-turn-helix domain-containing protein [Lihuaxuella thermophila]|uniref:Gamma-soluble NSF attachment protein n=1 Tax=Lihuaxuella thermophila TaxID=1173111 RepID=A0A1H8AXN6_9BACL|nr:helix-turn-helix domain-containing protein [Lihuaxuella thermophila]SEM74548.1 Soluble NSF attachment protein, SNAP [Lihuaxuella thermophila]
MITNHKELGSALRRIRKTKKLRLEDLADENISTGTISFIERGFETVKEGKWLYLCKKLGVDLLEIPGLIEHERRKTTNLQNELTLIESRIDLGYSKKSLKELNQLAIKTDGMYMETIHYLKARCYYSKESWKKAKNNFELAIQIVDESNSSKSNIKAACFKDLARISFFQDNDLNQALKYTEEGISAYQPDGDRKDIIYFLLTGKVSYLEKLKRYDEALQVLIELWQSIDKIKNLEVILNMYEIRASILNKKRQYPEALKYAIEGYKIASSNQKYERSIELLTTWGDICKNSKDYSTAEQCYTLALELEDNIKKKYLLVSTYTQLGRLYIEQKDWDKAHATLETAVEQGLKAGDMQRYTQALTATGDYYLAREMYSEAVIPYEKANELSKKHEFHGLRREILVNMSECWKQLNHTEKYLETMNQLQVLLRLGGV